MERAAGTIHGKSQRYRPYTDFGFYLGYTNFMKKARISPPAGDRETRMMRGKRYMPIQPSEQRPKQPVRYTRPSDAQLKKRLTPQQFAVVRKDHTEEPYSSSYWQEQRPGIYVDIATGEPLFCSNDKFDAGCGWPSFTRPIRQDLLEERPDHSLGMCRTEVRSKLGDSHLGHVFDDGPAERGGLRYCINAAALRFIPKSEMQRAGYGYLLPLVDG
ncbi:peptide-methionine (R)-S-oxide reductase MsrB [Neobittarella massiliensis]|uniref:Peptide methionine sulfoxide reductase MsrB n=2 Tax=Oscillospiraceae TaxID=216572 RepID=A0A8J6M104_9FIRM|nr:peptide-methionine (R)-S-oxide reductase MsrB [Neobittarella massiliensis]